MPRIAVIAGAGPAGLTAAYELLKRTDIKPIVFEATGAIGGIAQTVNYKDNRIDIGGHRFFSKSQRVMDWWFNILPLQGAPAADTQAKAHTIEYATEALLDYLCTGCAPDSASLEGTRLRRGAPDPALEDEVMLQRPRLSRIFYRRRFFPYPLQISIRVFRQLGLCNTVLVGASYLKAKLRPLKDETFLDAFFINRFGKRLYQTFFKDYTEKVWGIPCSKIRADWGAQRIKGLSLLAALRAACKDLFTSGEKRDMQARETSLITRFFYPKLGPGQMWETVAAHIRRCGGEVHLNQPVDGVQLAHGQVVAAIVGGERVPCDYFFSTMPIRQLMRVMDPPPPEPVAEIARGLLYRDFLTVGLLLSKLHVHEQGMALAERLPDNWIYVQEGDVQVGRIQCFNNWSPYLVADPDNTVWIGLEYFVNQGDALWEMSDEALVALGTQELVRIAFIEAEDVLDGCVTRMEKAYPMYYGTYHRLPELQQWVTGVTNLFLVGRNGMHRYNNQDHSMLTAMTAVDNLVEGRTDSANLWEVNVERVYHEEK